MNERHTRLVETPVTGSWADLITKLREPGTSEAFYVLWESLGVCALLRAAADDVAPPPRDAWEGRVFDASAELRWRARADGTFEGWITHESPDEGDTCLRRKRRYYLLGLASEPDPRGHGWVFTEARYPGRSFVYPVNDPPPAKGKEKLSPRAYIEVYEYRAARPDWRALGSEVEVAAALNTPMLVAHRFAGVGVGFGEEL